MKKFWDSIIRTQCACMHEDKIWFFSNEINALLYLDKDTMETTYVTSFEKYQGSQGWLFTKMLNIGNVLILIPFMANDIVMYYPLEKNYKIIEMNKTNNSVYFLTSVIDDNKVLLFPALSFEYYYIFDIKASKIITCNINLSNILKNTKHIDSFMTGIYLNGFFYTNKLKGKNIYKFSIEDELVEKYEYDDIKITTMIYLENKGFLILNSTGDVVKQINLSQEIEKTYELSPSNRSLLYMRNEKMGYSDIKKIDNNNWLAIPVSGNDLIVYEDGKLKRIKLDWGRIKTTVENAKIFSEVISDEMFVYLLPFQSNTIIRLNRKKQEVEYFEKRIKNPAEIRFLANYYIDKKNEVAYEGDLCLKSFLEYIKGD